MKKILLGFALALVTLSLVQLLGPMMPLIRGYGIDLSPKGFKLFLAIARSRLSPSTSPPQGTPSAVPSAPLPDGKADVVETATEQHRRQCVTVMNSIGNYDAWADSGKKHPEKLPAHERYGVKGVAAWLLTTEKLSLTEAEIKACMNEAEEAKRVAYKGWWRIALRAGWGEARTTDICHESASPEDFSYTYCRFCTRSGSTGGCLGYAFQCAVNNDVANGLVQITMSDGSGTTITYVFTRDYATCKALHQRYSAH